MPLDPGYFTPEAWEWIGRGKHERSLARHLPSQVAGAARHLELGAGCGFRAALLHKNLPQLRQWVQEDVPLRLKLIRAVWARNGLAEGEGLQLMAGALDEAHLARLLAEVRPDSLLVGDTWLAPATLLAALKLQRLSLRSLVVAGNALLKLEEWRQTFPELMSMREGEGRSEGYALRDFSPEVLI